MALSIIVSYDDTDNDRDALALGRLLAFSGAELSLAYVRHSLGRGARGEAGRGAAGPRRRLGRRPGHAAPRRRQPRTSVGLAELAERENADVDRLRLRVPHRRRHGQARDLGPQAAAGRPGGDRRRTGGPALAPVGQRQHGRRHRRGRRGRAGRPPRASPRRSAPRSRDARRRPVDLLVVGSRPEAPQGQGHPQRLQRLRGRGGDLPGDGRPARRHGLASRLRSPASAGCRPPPRNEDDGRDLRVAAVDPLADASPSRSPLRPWPATIAASGSSGESVSTTKAPGRRRRRARRRASRRVTSSAERSAFDQPWPKERSGASRSRPLEDLQRALARLPLAVAQLDRAVLQPRARRSARRSSACSRLKTRA